MKLCLLINNKEIMKNGTIYNISCHKKEYEDVLNYEDVANWLLKDLNTDNTEQKLIMINKIKRKISTINSELIDLDKWNRSVSELYVSSKYKNWFSAVLVHSMQAYSLSTHKSQSPGIDLIFKDSNKNIHVVEVKYTPKNQSNNMIELIEQLKRRKNNIEPLLSALELAINNNNDNDDMNSFLLKMQNGKFKIDEEKKLIFSGCLLSPGKYKSASKIPGFQKIIIEIKNDNED